MLDIPRHPVTADVGVFGGSGFYEFLDDATAIEVDTPYGPPSEAPVIGTIGDRRVAFIARHGHDHRIPAHRVEYRANIWAMATLGVRAIIAPFACGSLRAEVDRGDLVMVDQLIDRTTGRAGTFYDGPETWHQEFADPYDRGMSDQIAELAEAQGRRVHRGGTVVVIPGPRFSTRAESRFHAAMGGDLVNMTQAPEAALAAEAAIPYVGIGLVTDFDAGLDGDPTIAAVTQADVFAYLQSNATAIRTLLTAAIPILHLP